jgi:hypothetical protein
MALAIVLAFAWGNFLGTVKWAEYPGALNGWKRPWYFAALLAVTLLLAFGRRVDEPVRLRGVSWLNAGACVLLAAAFLASFPPASWFLMPFFDDWSPRFQSTVDGLELLKQGAVVGWQWNLLGGHQTSADLTQPLTMVAAVPMLLFGDRLGFHLLHFVLVVGIPYMVYRDALAETSRDVARLTAFFVLICTVGIFGTIMPSGDTNAIAGVFSAMLALTGSRLARAGRRVGAVLLVLGLALAVHSHAGFFMYACLFLAFEAVFYRDWRMAVRAGLAIAAAVAASLPQNVELLLYPDFFITNNIIYAKEPIDWLSVARKLFYNVEILLHPHRWFNDYLSLTAVFLAVLIWLAWQPGRHRARLYAGFALLTMAMLRLDVPEAGYLFARPMHMLVAVTPLPLAWFVVHHSGSRWLAWSLVAVIGLYVQTYFGPVWHVDQVRDFDAALVDRVASRDGNMVLLENSPHRDLDAAPNRRTARTPFGVHFEMMLTDATGKRLYGQTWDCWHWTPFRGQVVAAGSFRGRAIGETPMTDFVSEMRKWGVQHLLVWSDATRAYLDGAPAQFRPRWSSGAWTEYELVGADIRSVVMPEGSGTLEPGDQLSGKIHLTKASAGRPVVARMNYYPAWRASSPAGDVELFDVNGQLAFTAPADGDYTVDLIYPRRRGLIAVAILALLGGMVAVAGTCVTRSSHSAAA